MESVETSCSKYNIHISQAKVCENNSSRLVKLGHSMKEQRVIREIDHELEYVM